MSSSTAKTPLSLSATLTIAEALAGVEVGEPGAWRDHECRAVVADHGEVGDDREDERDGEGLTTPLRMESNVLHRRHQPAQARPSARRARLQNQEGQNCDQNTDYLMMSKGKQRNAAGGRIPGAEAWDNEVAGTAAVTGGGILVLNYSWSPLPMNVSSSSEQQTSLHWLEYGRRAPMTAAGQSA